MNLSMKNQFLVVISTLALLTACSSTSSDSPQEPQQTPDSSTRGKVTPPGSITLDGGDAQLTYALQQYALNTLSETSPARVGLFYKVFSLKSDRDLTIGIDNIISDSEGCQQNDPSEIEILVTEESKNANVSDIVGDLIKKPRVDIKAGVNYKVRVYFKNYGRCEIVKYGFALLAFEPQTKRLASAPSPRLPGTVVCLAQDQNGQQKEVLFSFALGKLDRPEIWMKKTGSYGQEFLFSRSSACGDNLKQTIQCPAGITFNGSNFARSLSCTSNGILASEGHATFDLKTGEGRLACQNIATSKVFDLSLRECHVQ